jgi:hypothetical protein|tara:strand:- start:264 stop:419 length:156 start_codon:yes stop_codon:yes gene_type:complete
MVMLTEVTSDHGNYRAWYFGTDKFGITAKGNVEVRIRIWWGDFHNRNKLAV